MKLNFKFNKPNIKLSATARKRLAVIVTLFVLFGAMMFLFATVPAAVNAQATATPTQTPTTAPTDTPTPTPIATGLPNPQGGGFLQYLRCGEYSFGLVTPGACLQTYNGSDIEMFSAAGARTIFVDGETGNITSIGAIAQGSTGVKCVSGTQAITGSGTVVPGTLSGAGISTPSAVMASLASDSTGDLHHVSTTKSSGVVTLKLWNSALTPVASSGAGTVDFIVCGQ